MKKTSCPTYYIFFRNLANPVKVSIISSLKNKEMSVNELVRDLKEEQSKISHALSSLSHCNIVISRHSGKKRIYSLNKNTIIPILKIIDKHKCKHCGM
ncbi:MAG: metalloregulator ArsR/SmtB family transcription factor [Nanoarchaeota archaeon]